MEEKYETIATKIWSVVKNQLDRILERMKMNYYQWFQLMCEVTIRMADDKHNLSDHMAKLIQMFEMVPGWKDPATFCDPNTESEVESAVYFIKQKGKKGLKVVMQQKLWFDGEWQETENVQEIVEAVLSKCLPKTFTWLRQRTHDLDCNRVFELILKLADDAKAEFLAEDIEDMFKDNNFYEYGQSHGKAVEYGQRTKRVKHQSPEKFIEQGVIVFGDDDRELADMEAKGTDPDAAKKWLEENTDGDRPFGMEW